jgi:cell division protein FtsL
MNAYVREYQKIERHRRRRDSFVLRYFPALLLVAAAVVVGKVYVQSVALRWSNHVVELRRAAQELEVANEELTRSLASLTTRERVSRDAARRLGMVSPDEENLVWLPVADPALGGATGEGAAPGRTAGGWWQAWLDRLFQDEALALTSE